MRKVYRTKRPKIGLLTGVALWGTAIAGVASGNNVAAAPANADANGVAAPAPVATRRWETANANGAASVPVATSRLEAAARNDANGGFWPRLGSGAFAPFGGGENAGLNVAGNEAGAFVAAAGNVGNETGALVAAERGRVEPANFVGYSASDDFAEQENSVSGRTRLVDWTTPDAAAQTGIAAPGNASQTGGTASPPVPTAPVGALSEAGRVGETTAIGETGRVAETAKAGGERRTGQIGRVGEGSGVAARSKTPILRDDEPTAAARSGGSWGSALVSTFGALAVVLGAFFALVAFLKRTGPKNGGAGSALEIVDSLAVGDKARLLTIRWGNRLILAAKTPEKITSLAEIADVEEASAILAEIERRKNSALNGDVGAKAAAIWKRGLDAASVWRTARETKGRRQ